MKPTKFEMIPNFHTAMRNCKFYTQLLPKKAEKLSSALLVLDPSQEAEEDSKN